MIQVSMWQRSPDEPSLAIVIPASPDYILAAERLAKYVLSLNAPVVLVIIGTNVDEPYNEGRCRNYAALEVPPDCPVVFSCCGAYPPPRLIYDTVNEIRRDPEAMCVAQRVDGEEAGGWHENDWALGDWQCMNKALFLELGGFDESFENAGYLEFDLLTRAYLRGSRIVVMDDRVWHPWHPILDATEYREGMKPNIERSFAKGLPRVHWRYPNMMALERDGIVRPLVVSRQRGTVLPALPHRPLRWDFVEQDYPLIPGTGDGIDEQVGNRYRPAFPYVRNKSVLDWGCGAGFGTFLLAQVAQTVIGYDRLDNAILWAQQYRRENLSFTIEKPEAVFDVVVSCECIEHCANPEAELAEMAARCGELMYITTPLTDGGPQKNPYHLHSFTARTFEDLLRTQFRVIEPLPLIPATGATCQAAVCRR